MPTLRPRHMITESDRISQALVHAAVLWPELSQDRGALLRKVLESGIERVEDQAQQKSKARLAAIAKSAGSLSGVWPTSWREDLRAEWPE